VPGSGSQIAQVLKIVSPVSPKASEILDTGDTGTFSETMPAISLVVSLHPESAHKLIAMTEFAVEDDRPRC